MFFPEIQRSTWRDPWSTLREFQSEMDRLFAGPGVMTGGGFPRVNVWSSDEKVVVAAELPGIDPDTVDISVMHNTLTIKGERKIEAPEKGAEWERRERFTGPFTRTFELPFAINSDGVRAEYQRGILLITLPRAEADKPRRIQIR